MTGFGSGAADTPCGRVTVEARSVNHRFAEIGVRLPREFAGFEDRVRVLFQERVRRGRVDVAVVKADPGRRPRTVRLDGDLAAAYVQALRELSGVVGATGEISLEQVASLPDVLRIEEDRAEAESCWPALEEAARAAADGLLRMRSAEGARLATDMQARIASIEQMTAVVASRGRDVVRGYGERLRARVEELLGETPLDEGRLAAELAVFAERCDVSEELTRLRSHLVEIRQTVEGADGAVGRKLEFIVQEMFREVNTIGSKANDLDVTRATIAMKSELESLREQIQNIE